MWMISRLEWWHFWEWEDFWFAFFIKTWRHGNMAKWEVTKSSHDPKQLWLFTFKFLVRSLSHLFYEKLISKVKSLKHLSDWSFSTNILNPYFWTHSAYHSEQIFLNKSSKCFSVDLSDSFMKTFLNWSL